MFFRFYKVSVIEKFALMNNTESESSNHNFKIEMPKFFDNAFYWFIRLFLSANLIP